MVSRSSGHPAWGAGSRCTFQALTWSQRTHLIEPHLQNLSKIHSNLGPAWWGWSTPAEWWNTSSPEAWKITRQGARLIFGFLCFGKLYHKCFLLSVHLLLMVEVSLSRVFSTFYQSAFTNMWSCLHNKPESDELGRITPFGRQGEWG